MEALLRQYKDEMGWNDQSIIGILLKYIQNQNNDSTFEDFLRTEADQEIELVEETDV